MKESKSNYLYVEFGSRGEKECIEWREDKSFKEKKNLPFKKIRDLID